MIVLGPYGPWKNFPGIGSANCSGLRMVPDVQHETLTAAPAAETRTVMTSTTTAPIAATELETWVHFAQLLPHGQLHVGRRPATEAEKAGDEPIDKWLTDISDCVVGIQWVAMY